MRVSTSFIAPVFGFGLALAVALPVALFGVPGVAHAQDCSSPSSTYIRKCAPCHGDTGKADGPGANTMLPRPRVFAGNANYKFRSTPSGALPLREDLLRTINRGLPGTAMPSFRHLTAAQKQELVTCIEGFATDEFTDPINLEERVAMPQGSPPEITAELIERGKQVYKESKCWECHGQDGRGDGIGWEEKKDAWGDVVVPANLVRWNQLRGGHEIEDLFRATLTGLSGTPMPNFPAPKDPANPQPGEMTENDRWALAAWLQSIQMPEKDKQDQVIVARRMDELPTSAGDEKWGQVPQVIFPIVGQIIEKPRLFWPSVTEVYIQAAYDDRELVLLVLWDDRNASKGTNLTEYPAAKDPIYDIFVKTDHPDQFAIQFPTADFSGGARPYFLFGDAKRPVNLWWWNAARQGIFERNASGYGQIADQGEESQSLVGQVNYHDSEEEGGFGYYSMIVRRRLTTSDDKDVQFEVGKFMPIQFNVWQGSRGEIGQRRGISTWYLIVLEPPVPPTALYNALAGAGIALTVLLGIAVFFYGSRAKKSGLEGTEVGVHGIPLPYRIALAAVGVPSVAGLLYLLAAPELAPHFEVTAGVEETLSPEDLNLEGGDLAEAQRQQLSGYQWVDQGEQTVQTPIDRAKALVLEQKGADVLVPAVKPPEGQAYYNATRPAVFGPPPTVEGEITGPPLEVGQQVYAKKLCITCHSIDGSKSTGPTFKGLWGSEEKLADGSTVLVDEAYVKESIAEPNAKITAGYRPNQMNLPAPLTDGEINGVIEFLKTLQ